MPFGAVDYTQLNRISSALSEEAQQREQSALFGMKILQDQADRQNAQQTREWVSKQMEPEIVVQPGVFTTTLGKKATATPLSTGSPDSGVMSLSSGRKGSYMTPLSTAAITDTETKTTEGEPSVTLRYKSPMEMLQIMARAGNMLGQTGGRHSEQAAKDIHSYLTARIALEPKGKQTQAELAVKAAQGDQVAAKALELLKKKEASGISDFQKQSLDIRREQLELEKNKKSSDEKVIEREARRAKDNYDQADEAVKQYEARRTPATLDEWSKLLEKETPQYGALLDKTLSDEERGRLMTDFINDASINKTIKDKIREVAFYAAAKSKRAASQRQWEDRGYTLDESGKLVKAKEKTNAKPAKPKLEY